MRNAENGTPVTTSSLLERNSVVAFLSPWDHHSVLSIWGEQIAEYLTAPDNRRHAWHAWLAVHGTAVRNVTETYRFLTFAKQKHILNDAFGSCPAGMISALGKLGPSARPKPSYFALHQVLSAGGLLANHICQSAKIDDDELTSLVSAIGFPVSNHVMRAILKCKMPASVLVELMWVISRLAPMYDDRRLIRCIVQGRQPAAILANLFGLVTFPAPPFGQIGGLIPILTAEQLRKTGKEFGNCLKGGEELAYALTSVLTGQRYFYRWNGDHPTVLSFCRCGPTGWILAERSGPRNARVAEATINRIADVLNGVPNVFVGKGAAGMLEWICSR